MTPQRPHVMPPSAPSDPRETVMKIVAEQSGVARDQLRDETRIVEDLHMDGDDVVEIVEQVATTFGVDMALSLVPPSRAGGMQSAVADLPALVDATDAHPHPRR